MASRIIVKNLPKKFTEEKFKLHFSKTGQVTDATLKYTKDGKFRQFGFIGYKSDDETNKAIEYFNNTFIDASRIVVETCKPLNDPERGRPWSKYSKESSSYQQKNGKTAPTAAAASASAAANGGKDATATAKSKKKTKEEKEAEKLKKLDKLIGSELNEDEQFKEFLAANKAIKSKENIWKNDINLDIDHDQKPDTTTTTTTATTAASDDAENKESSAEKTKKKNKKKKDEEVETKADKKDDDATPGNDEEKKTKTKKDEKKTDEGEDEDEGDFENGRLFLRNLSYTCKEEELEKLFEAYGPIVECSMPIDTFSKRPKGFAYITCMFPLKALKAFNELDGTIFQGRMLHIMPAKNKKSSDEPSPPEGTNTHAGHTDKDDKFKAKRDAELKKKAQSAHNWNSLFISQDAIANLMATRYQVDKSELYDVHAPATAANKKKPSVAVKLAVGETQIVNDMRKFLVRNGVKLDALSSMASERSKTTILVKNLPSGTRDAELRDMFDKAKVSASGIRRLVMPEYGVAALVEFGERQEARDAFKKLAYRKFKSVPIYLEWAPVDIFEGDAEEKAKLEREEAEEQEAEEKKRRKSEKKNNDNEDEEEEEEEEDDNEDSYEPNATLFVKNLSFETNEATLQKLFSKQGKCKASIARKIAPNKEYLSMGYGFVKFKRASEANEAIKQLQDHSLDGHRLELKFSNRIVNVSDQAASASSRKAAGAAATGKNAADVKSSKLLVRNIPFEAKAKEIEELFRVFGQLKYVRLPKKVDGAHRGFGFVDFVTISDARRAYDALSHSTHLFGRRLVLEWAAPEQNQDVEVLRMREEQLAGPSNKRLRKSKLIEDLGGGGDEVMDGGGGGGMPMDTND